MSTLTLARRGLNSPASPIRALATKAQGAVDRGVNVMFMNIGQPDIQTPREMIEAYHTWNEDVLAYAPSDGFREYRQQLASYYNGLLADSGHSVDADQFLVTVGGSEALLFAIAAVTDPGDSILVVEPFYTNYAGYANMLGLGVDAVTTTPADGYHLDLAKVERWID